jgi:integral membrane sensor domain MASE1
MTLNKTTYMVAFVCSFPVSVIGPLVLLISYLSMKMTGVQFAKWKTAILVTVSGFLYLAALAFIFSSFLPEDFEPVRSGMLPALFLAFTMIVFSRTKYGKRHQDY